MKGWRLPTRFAARLGLMLAALALLSQSLAFAGPPMAPRDAVGAAAELSALLGPGIIVCAQADDSGAPAPMDCHDTCSVCHALAALTTLDAPILTALIAPPFRLAEILGRRSETPRPKPARTSLSLARGPPSLT